MIPTAACADDALRRLDPGDRRACRQGVEIVDDEDDPVRRVRRWPRPMRSPSAARNARAPASRTVARVEEIGARRAGLRLAARAPGRRFGVLGGGFGVGGQGGDPLVEPRRPVLQIAAPVADVQD